MTMQKKICEEIERVAQVTLYNNDLKKKPKEFELSTECIYENLEGWNENSRHLSAKD